MIFSFSAEEEGLIEKTADLLTGGDSVTFQNFRLTSCSIGYVFDGGAGFDVFRVPTVMSSG